MTRPVAEIFAEAERDGWPTSSIDAMANHHLCSGLARDYVNGCFAGELASPREDGPAQPVQDAALCGPAGAASTTPKGTLMGETTPEDLKQLEDLIKWKQDHGEDAAGFQAIHDLATGKDPGPQKK